MLAVSDVADLSFALLLASFFFVLLVGNGGKAQSWLNSSGEGGLRMGGAVAFREGCGRGERLPVPGLMGEAVAEPKPLLTGVSSPSVVFLLAAKGSMRGTKGLGGLVVAGCAGGVSIVGIGSCSGSATSGVDDTVAV